MTLQVDVTIKRTGHIVEIQGTGGSVNFHPEDFEKTLSALIAKCIELQPDLTSDNAEMDHLKRSVEIQLTDIYADYEEEGKNRYAGTNEQETSETKSKEFNSKHNANASTKKTYYIHKYSKGIPLAEAVIVAGEPYFIQMKGGLDFDLLDKLTIDNLDLKPKDTHSYLYEPYVFESRKEIEDYLKLASEKSNFDRIFKLVKTIIMKYVVAEDHYLTLLASRYYLYLFSR